MTENKILKTIIQATAHVIPVADLEKKLAQNKPLIVKLGVDPTAPDLHLGHAVVLSKLKQLQDLGHKIVFLIGDFTARIGDPSGKSKTRPPLSKEQIRANLQTYIDQVWRVLDPDKITVAFNSAWLEKLGMDDVIQLCSRLTVAKIIERDDFQKRLSTGVPIALHELLYPVLQAYDSVVLKADIELGGEDQLFNLLLGRTLQEQFGQEPQVVITVPLLEGLDGKQKMSKSLDNYVSLAEEPGQAFGKIMSISDELMWRYYRILLGVADAELARMKAEEHPKELKKKLAFEILNKFWSPVEAESAQKQFESLFEKRDYSQAQKVALPDQSPIWIVDLLKHVGAVTSTSEAKRLIDSGAVHIDDTVVTDFKAQIVPASGMHIKVGKHRIYRLS